jgi:hypothetical protein
VAKISQLREMFVGKQLANLMCRSCEERQVAHAARQLQVALHFAADSVRPSPAIKLVRLRRAQSCWSAINVQH